MGIAIDKSRAVLGPLAKVERLALRSNRKTIMVHERKDFSYRYDDAMHYPSTTMKKSALFYLLSLLWPVVLVTRTANAVERSLTVSTIVDIVGGKEYCKTPWDAQENFDHFTWWNLQIELPADLSVVVVSYNTNASASAQEDGFVQAANGEEVVLVNYTFFLSEDDDGAQDPFVVQWTYNDHSEWYTYEFCQNDNGHSSGVDCRDTSTRGLYFGTCWHERDGMTSGWGTTTRSASLIVSVDCCSRSSSSSSSSTASIWASSNMTFSVAAASALATRVLLFLLGLVTLLLLLLGTLLVWRKSTCSRISQNTSNTNINNNNYKYYDDCNHQKESGGGGGGVSGGWLSFWWQMESSRNQASAADDPNDDDDNKGNNHHHGLAIRTKQEGFTTVVREFQ
jgi:hypothetical protein